jgi:tripartite-type tricarboxylate transporter receptor subunit TctC
MWGPKDVPPDVVGALNAATAEAMRGLENAGRLADLGVEPTYGTPQEFGTFQAMEVQRNADLLKSVNFKPQ